MKPLRILFVVRPPSVHSARWINQIAGCGWDLHVFGAFESPWHPDFENVTAYAEIYANWSTNPQAPNIYTLDFALAWQPRPNFQLDVGINIGLNAAAPPYQIYMGIAQRF